MKQLNLEDTIITVDALNSQVKNSNYIIKKKGNYVFPIKENQGDLYKAIKNYFEDTEIIPIIKKNNNRYFCSIQKSNSKFHKREYFLGSSEIQKLKIN